MAGKKEIIKIRIIESAPHVSRSDVGSLPAQARQNPIKRQPSFKETFSSMLAGIIFAGLFSFSIYVFAIPPASPYAPGDTLNPNCAAGTTNCTVVSPVPYSGATAPLDLGAQNFTTTGTAKLQSNASNYATLTAASNGDLTIQTTSNAAGGNINLNSAVVGDATILGSTGTIVLGGTGGTNNENLKFDFETYADRVAVTSSTGVATLDLSSLNLVTTGTLTLGASTPGTLVTRVKAGAATESDANGALVVDSADGRLYFRYGSAWHYVAQTAGFQVPNFESTDPISGAPIKPGDVVLGMIDKSYEDNTLHGVWVKWDSVKSQLLAEARSQLSQTLALGNGSVQGVNSDTVLDKVKNALFSLGLSMKDGAATITNLVTEKFSAKIARIEKLEMVDKQTGDIYCTWIENGNWQKAKGQCDSARK